jgi:hypothetical protein
MNQDRKEHEAALVDPLVSAHYEAVANENTPPELDRAVLRSAGSAIPAGRRQKPFATWFRALAFVAIAGLSLVIVIDLSSFGIIESIGIMKPAAVSSPAARPQIAVQPMMESAPDIAAEKRTPALIADALRREKSASAPMSKIAAPDDATSHDDVAAEAPGRCDDDVKSSVEEWWNCIEKLRQAGMADSARSEFGFLSEKFPDFAPPANGRSADLE